mmetsp:Transcript_37739/g.48634  ORF Transcript_37739/g.48634 Transcript_37739/m.48634 type:complete len:483 (+) Transcript_37739:3-1451(+)
MQVESRLLEYEELRKAKLDALRQQREAEENKNIRDKPDVSLSQKNRTPKNRDRQPIHERLMKTRVGEETAKRLRELVEEQEQECTFRPKIPARSASVARLRGTSESNLPRGEEGKRSVSTGRGAILKGKESIHDRLYRKKVGDAEKVSKLSELKSRQEMEECTFTPRRISVDNTSPRRSVSKDEGDGHSESKNKEPVWKRLNKRASQAALTEAEQRRLLKQAELEMQECTFAPQLTRHPSIQLEERPVQPAHERLHQLQTDYATIAKLRESRELEGCTFQPHVRETGGTRDPNLNSSLDSTSVNSQSSTNIFDRLTEEAAHRQKRALVHEKLKVERETEKCTFQPEVKGFEGIDQSKMAEQDSKERLCRPVEPYMKRAEIEARWRMEQEFRERHNGRSKSAYQARSTTSQQQRRDRRTSSRERNMNAPSYGTPRQEKQRSASASKVSSISSKAKLRSEIPKGSVAADFDKWQASIEQQINKL